MKKLIELDAALKAIGRVPDYGDGMVFEALSHAQRDVELLPTVDAVPVRHAHWIRHEYADIVDGYLVPEFECSECHSWKKDDSDYCPDCGAKIDGKDGEQP